MAINLNNVPSSVMDGINRKDNKPSIEEGYEGGIDWNTAFDDFDDASSNFGSSGDGFDVGGGEFGGAGKSLSPDLYSGNAFGGDNFSNIPSSNGGFGNNASGFGGNAGGFGSSTSGFGGNSGFGNTGSGFNFNTLNIPGQQQQQQQQQQQPPKKDFFDVVGDATMATATATGKIAKDFMNSVKTKTYDDFASISTDWLFAGLAVSGLSLLLFIIKLISGLENLGKLSGNLAIGGICTAVTGGVGLGLAIFGVLSMGAPTETTDELRDNTINTEGLTVSDDELDDAYSALLDEYLLDDEYDFGDPSGDGDESDSDNFNNTSGWNDDVRYGTDEPEYESIMDKAENDKHDAEERIANLMGNAPRIDRRFLVENIGPFFKLNQAEFNKKTELSPGDSEYDTVRALVLQAIAEAAKVDLADLDIDVKSITSTLFCYIVICDRVRGLSRTDDIKKEVESYFREDGDDVSVAATVTIEHGNYKIIITKGDDHIITVGDCLTIPDVKEFFLDTENQLPAVVGIDSYGNPVLADMKNYATSMVAGKQRSGKSWYLNGIMVTMMAFNTPEDILFVFFDPKSSTLFSTLACMPHVIGLHDDSNIVAVLNEIIYTEGDRRKKILKEHRCETIWELRERKGVKLPVLCVVMDEFMTIKANLEQQGMYKEFEEQLNMLITQLAFVGIHLMFVPHRAQGVVSKTTRAMILFAAAIRADNAIVKETLDEAKWDRPLVKPGDTALKLADTGVTKYVRGATVGTKDYENTAFIEELAKAWYKIGADIPNMSHLRLTCNRDETEIADILGINASDVTHVQYDNDAILNNKNKSVADNWDSLELMSNEAMRQSLFGDDDAVSSSSWGSRTVGSKDELDEDWVASLDSRDDEDNYDSAVSAASVAVHENQDDYDYDPDYSTDSNTGNSNDSNNSSSDSDDDSDDDIEVDWMERVESKIAQEDEDASDWMENVSFNNLWND